MRLMPTLLTASFLAVGTLASVQAREFTVVGWGGAAQDAQRATYFDPFAKQMGIKFKEDTYLGGWGQFQAMEQTGQASWDVVQVETAEMIRGCEEGMFLKLGWSKLPPKDSFIPHATSDCGVGVITWGVMMAYDADRLKGNAPTKLADFFDTKHWPGKRAMRAGPKINLELALMADGVQPDDVYKVLSTSAGVDRAFAKLDTIKPLVQWWKGGAQAQEWLASGDVQLAIAYSGRVAEAPKHGRNLKAVWDHAYYAIDSWVIPAKSPHIDTAYKYISFASDAKRQAKNAELLPYGPTRKGAEKLLPASVVAGVPVGANIKNALFGGSAEANDFWVDRLEELTQRWDAWVAK